MQGEGFLLGPGEWAFFSEPNQNHLLVLINALEESKKASVSGEMLSSFSSQNFLIHQHCSPPLHLLAIPQNMSTTLSVYCPCTWSPAAVPNSWVVLDSLGTLSFMPTPSRTDCIWCLAKASPWGLSHRISQHFILHGALKASASASSQSREMGRTPRVFRMSLALKSVAFTIGRSRCHILLLQIGFKVQCIWFALFKSMSQMYFGFAVLMRSLEISGSVLGCKEARTVTIKGTRYNLPLPSSLFFLVQCRVYISQSFCFNQCY